MTAGPSVRDRDLLDDNNVLVNRGLAARAVLALAEMFDPSTDTSGRTGAMATPRYRQTATRLAEAGPRRRGEASWVLNALSSPLSSTTPRPFLQSDWLMGESRRAQEQPCSPTAGSSSRRHQPRWIAVLASAEIYERRPAPFTQTVPMSSLAAVTPPPCSPTAGPHTERQRSLGGWSGLR